MKAVLLDAGSLGPGIDLQPLLRQVAFQIHEHTHASDLKARLRDFQLVVTNKVVLAEHHFCIHKHIRFVGVLATGVNNIDLLAAKKNGVTVCNVQQYCNYSVAEYVMMMVLHLNFQFQKCQEKIKQGAWQQSPFFCDFHGDYFDLHGQKMVIVGSGNLGAAVAQRATAFGIQVEFAARPGKKMDTKRRSLQELLPVADILSLHCPLTSDTENLIDARALSLMKPTSILINCARGGLVDEKALHAAITAKIIGGAAIDVQKIEPPTNDCYLSQNPSPQIVLTPHVDWASRQSRQEVVRQTARNIEAYLKGNPCNQVFPTATN